MKFQSNQDAYNEEAISSLRKEMERLAALDMERCREIERLQKIINQNAMDFKSLRDENARLCKGWLNTLLEYREEMEYKDWLGTGSYSDEYINKLRDDCLTKIDEAINSLPVEEKPLPPNTIEILKRVPGPPEVD